MTRGSDGTNVPVSPAQASCPNMVSPDGSVPDLEGTGLSATTMEEKINEIYSQLPLFRQNPTRIENCVQTLAQTVAAQTARITNIEQIIASILARITSLETNAASGPTALDLPMTTEIQDVDLIHLQALKVNRHEVPFYYDSHASSTSLELRSGSIALWKSQKLQHITSQSQFIAKQVPYQSDSFLKKGQVPGIRDSI